VKKESNKVRRRNWKREVREMPTIPFQVMCETFLL
jgi:hypothetical protein